MNDFLNEESAKSLVETPSPWPPVADTLKKPAIDRWENEGGELLPPSKPPRTETGTDG